MRVRDEIPLGQHIVGNAPIDGPEVVEFTDGPHVRLGNQLLDVGRSGRRRERRVEQTRVRDELHVPERHRPQRQQLGDELTERLVFFALAPLQRAQDVVVEIESGANASDANTTRI